jgi:hypothetical protein
VVWPHRASAVMLLSVQALAALRGRDVRSARVSMPLRATPLMHPCAQVFRAGSTSLMRRSRPRTCGKSTLSSLKCRTPRATKGRIYSIICSGAPTKPKSSASRVALKLFPARASASRCVGAQAHPPLHDRRTVKGSRPTSALSRSNATARTSYRSILVDDTSHSSAYVAAKRSIWGFTAPSRMGGNWLRSWLAHSVEHPVVLPCEGRLPLGPQRRNDLQRLLQLVDRGTGRIITRPTERMAGVRPTRCGLACASSWRHTT